MKTAFLLNRVRTGANDEENIRAGIQHDSHLFGLLRLRKLGVETEYLEPEQFYSARFMKRVRNRVLNIFWVHILIFPKLFRYDVIFSSTAYGSLLLWALCPFRKPKWVILDFNLLGTIGGGKTLRQNVFAFAISRASGIVTISEQEKIDLEQRFPHLKGRIEFIHEATDTAFFTPQSAEPEEKFILSVGKDPARDFKTLIDATAGLGLKVKLATKPERAKELEPLPAHVSICHFTHEEMKKQFARSLLVVVPLKVKSGQLNDSMGTFSVIEGMAMGKVVIATRTKSMESYITHGENGWLVEAHNPEELRKQIQYVLDNPAHKKEMEENAREFVVKHCNPDIFAERLHLFFMRLLK